MNAKNQIYTDFIVDHLTKGKIKYNDVCTLFCSKFQLNERSFNKYWKAANETYSQQLQTINDAKMEVFTAHEIESKSFDVIARDEAIEMLGKAAKYFYNKIETDPENANPKDAAALCNAIDKIAKIEGWSTIKIEQNTFSESNLDNFKTFVLSKAEGFQEVDI